MKSRSPLQRDDRLIKEATPLQWPTYFALNAKSCLFDWWDPQIGSLLTPARFWSFKKWERGGLGEVDDGKWRVEIKLGFFCEKIKGEYLWYKREILGK